MEKCLAVRDERHLKKDRTVGLELEKLLRREIFCCPVGDSQHTAEEVGWS
jgi:hypothetical protein